MKKFFIRIKKFFNNVYFLSFLVFVIMCILIFVLIGLDLYDIRKEIPLTQEYDWLSFIGSLFGGLISIFVVLITLHNEKKLNEEREIEEKKRNCFSFLMPNSNCDDLYLKINQNISGFKEYEDECLLVDNNKNVNVYESLLYLPISMNCLNDYIPYSFRIKSMEMIISPKDVTKHIINCNVLKDDFYSLIINKTENVNFPIKIAIKDPNIFNEHGHCIFNMVIEYKNMFGVSTICEYTYNFRYSKNECWTNKIFFYFDSDVNFKILGINYYE